MKDDNQHNKIDNTNVDSVSDKAKPIAPIQQRLRIAWLGWLAYRAITLPLLIGVFHPLHPDIIGGMTWQLLWLTPALILTVWVMKGTSAYALLMGSMLTLVYLGASGVTVMFRFFDSGVSVIWVYIIDLLLISTVNYYLFVLLKRLPSMNGVVKDKRR